MSQEYLSTDDQTPYKCIPDKLYINFIKKHCLGKTHLKCFNEFIGKSIYFKSKIAVLSTS